MCVKHVPDTQGDRRIENGRIVRGEDDTLNELDEYAIEAGVQLVEQNGGEVIALCMGPDDAQDSILRALQMGADRALHVCDPTLAGADAPGTAMVLSAAVAKIAAEAPIDLILLGMASLDGMTSVVPGALATYLDMPYLGLASQMEFADQSVIIERAVDGWTYKLSASLPAVVSVTDQVNEPRYPSFKALKAARSKPVDVCDWDSLLPFVEDNPYFRELHKTDVVDAHEFERAGEQEIIEDTGEAGIRLAQYLMDQMD